MANFEYIRDERFRVGLEADYTEMNATLDAGAWKAVHVLAGSIVEAVLIDYLLEVAATSEVPAPYGDPLKLDLADAIAACKEAGVLSEKTANLSAVIRSYRNLIHPGRVVRLGEKVNEQGARIAVALTEMVVAEVGQARGDKLGYSADQLATKIEGDPDTAALLKNHLLPKLAGPKLAGPELEKLLLRVLPERYLTEAQTNKPSTPSARALADAYRRTFDAVPDKLKKQAARWFADVVREQPAPVLHLYQEAFFRAPQLSSYTSNDAAVVIDHLFSRLVSRRSEALLRTAEGIGQYLTPAQASTAVDIVASEVSYGQSQDLEKVCRQWLLEELKGMRPAALAVVKSRQDAWVAMFSEKGQHARADRLMDLLTSLPPEDDLPF